MKFNETVNTIECQNGWLNRYVSAAEVLKDVGIDGITKEMKKMSCSRKDNF